MRILIIEPFFTGSHRRWAEELQRYSGHQVDIMSLPGRHWKWRMHGAAVSLARQFNELTQLPDLILATDMLDLTTFLALTRRKSASVPTALYFHENQITYPWSPTDEDVKLQRDNHYGFINYTSALAADKVFFNSAYHQESFLDALPGFLRQFPDKRELSGVEAVRTKSEILYLGMNLRKFDKYSRGDKNEVPVLLWNHRWEYDKNPTEFFESLFRLKAENVDFQLIVSGEQYRSAPRIFAEAKEKLADRILHFGYAADFEEYARLLRRADILPVTSRQDFFGGSVIEAIYCGCLPLLPRRLAYPEHVPAAYLYEDDFYEKLKEIILRFREVTADKQTALSERVKRYDWSVIRKEYTAAFEQTG